MNKEQVSVSAGPPAGKNMNNSRESMVSVLGGQADLG